MDLTSIRNAVILLVVIVMTFLLGFHLEYSPDSFIPAAFKGLINNEQVPTIYMYFLFWDRLFNVLYRYMPDISWYGWVLMLYTVVTGALLFKFLLGRLIFQNSIVRIIFVLLLFVFWIDSFVLINFTRIPIYSTGVLWLYALANPTFNLRSFKTILPYIFLLGAFFMRYESALATIAILFPSLLFIVKEKYRKRSFLLLIIGGVLCFIGLFSHTQLYNQPADQQAREIYDVHFDFFDAHMKAEAVTKEDSIRLVAMEIDFDGDQEMLSVEHYKALTLNRSSLFKNIHTLEYKIQLFEKSVGFLFAINQTFLYGYLLLFSLTLFLIYKNVRNVIVLILTQLWSWSILFFILFLTKYADRVAQPILTLMTAHFILSIFFSKPSYHYFKSRITLFVVIFFIGLHLKLKHSDYQKVTGKLQQLEIENKYIIQVLSELQNSQNKDIVFSNDGLEFLNRGVLNEVNASELRFYMLDNHLTYFRNMDKGVSDYAGGATQIDFYTHIVRQKNAPLIVSSEKRMQVYRDYFRILYGYDFQVNEVTDQYINFDVSRNELEVELYKLDVFRKKYVY